jgi:hypothetical protein
MLTRRSSHSLEFLQELHFSRSHLGWSIPRRLVGDSSFQDATDFSDSYSSLSTDREIKYALSFLRTGKVRNNIDRVPSVDDSLEDNGDHAGSRGALQKRDFIGNDDAYVLMRLHTNDRV